jgi:hypothetical protein
MLHEETKTVTQAYPDFREQGKSAPYRDALGVDLLLAEDGAKTAATGFVG